MITAFKRIMILATMVVCVAVSANAATYTFDDGGIGHDWSTTGNWYPDGTPGQYDTAIIPNGMTCEIALAHQSIRILEIQSGGLLQIKGKNLTMAGDDDPLYRLTVEGTLVFEIANTIPAGLILVDDLGIDGDGTISASGSGKKGEISPDSKTLYIADPEEPTDERVTIKGSVDFDVDIDNEGQLLVDAATDTMTIGSRANFVDVGGDKAKFKVTAGTMKFRKAQCLIGEDSVWDVAGGTLELVDSNHATWLQAHHLVKVSSGKLLLNWYFITDGGLEFSGGTIEVGPGRSVLFSKVEE